MTRTPGNERRIGGGFHRLKATLPKIASATYRAQGFAEAGVLTDWPAIVGPDLAVYTCPEALGREGALRVRVSGAIAVELQHLEPQILEKIATFFGYRAVTRLLLIQGPLPPRAGRRRSEPRALNPEEERDLLRTLDKLPDADLRAALSGLGRAVLARGARTEAGPLEAG